MGIGSHLFEGGCRFRVWAPNAKEVHVIGDFNNWKKRKDRLVIGPQGYWEGVVSNARAGHRYKYLIVSGDGTEYFRIDPAARDTLHSGLQDLHRIGSNAGVILDPSFDWCAYRTPRFEDFIIYQLHVGTFAGLNDGVATREAVATIADVQSKLDYIRAHGFNAVELLPIQEYRGDRSWGYNPSFFFAPESAYGSPAEYRRFVDEAHRRGLAVIFDVVYNHVSFIDNPLWKFDVDTAVDEGIYLSSFQTPWGLSPAYWREQVKDYFLENARMYFGEYNADGLRFDATRYIESNRGLNEDGWQFMQYLTCLIREAFPDKYLIAEHLPDHDSIVTDAGFSATWFARAHHEFQRAASGDNAVHRLKNFIGSNFGYGHNYPNQWNLVKYLLGSHDDCGDDRNGGTIHKADWERHRYFVEFFGGRDNWFARAKARMGWALNTVIPGTPMMFMGTECHHWGYWHDAQDQYGDHRFNWALACDEIGVAMRKMVADTNAVRWANPALRSETFQYTHEDPGNGVLAFKRWIPEGDNVVLAVVNAGGRNFNGHDYGICTGGQPGQWTQIFCSQDAAYGGWDGAGNAYYEPWTQDDGRIYINLPGWSVVVFRLKQP